MIHIENICKRFGTLEVLRGISLDVADGEVVAIVGASGAGKTTLLQIIGTLSRPDEGSVLISKRNVFALDDCALSRFRNEQIGFVFQFHHLLPEFTAFENVCIPGLIGRRVVGAVHIHFVFGYLSGDLFSVRRHVVFGVIYFVCLGKSRGCHADNGNG